MNMDKKDSEAFKKALQNSNTLIGYLCHLLEDEGPEESALEKEDSAWVKRVVKENSRLLKKEEGKKS